MKLSQRPILWLILTALVLMTWTLSAGAEVVVRVTPDRNYYTSEKSGRLMVQLDFSTEKLPLDIELLHRDRIISSSKIVKTDHRLLMEFPLKLKKGR